MRYQTGLNGVSAKVWEVQGYKEGMKKIRKLLVYLTELTGA
jgi:hypothetical protein